MPDVVPANNAFVGRVFLARGDGGSPEAFTRVCQTFAISGLGQKNSLVDITTFCSGGNMEYAGGLADGTEIQADLNMDTTSLGAVIKSMITDVQNKAIRDFIVELEGAVAGTVDLTFAFSARCLAWDLKPSVSKQNTITFNLKISGPVVYY